VIERQATDLLSPTLTAAVLRHARGRLRLAQRRFPEALGDRAREPLLREAVDVLADADAPLAHARALTDLGAEAQPEG
jgi:hypothetical protein